jgi:hypothetical protein
LKKIDDYFFFATLPGAAEDFFCAAGVNDDADFAPTAFFACPGGNGFGLLTITVLLHPAQTTIISATLKIFFILIFSQSNDLQLVLLWMCNKNDVITHF